MIKKGRNQLFISIILFGLFCLLPSFAVFAQTPTETPTPTPTGQVAGDSAPTPTPDKTSAAADLQKKIDELSGKVSSLRSQSNTLSSQIGAMDGQIKLYQLRVSATQQEIGQLTADIAVATGKVSKLETSLDEITKVLVNRVVKNYQVGNMQPIELLFSSTDVSDLISRSGYLRIAQEHDKQLIFDTQQARNDYQNQKDLFEAQKKKVEDLRAQLEAYNLQLEQEKRAKQSLLNATKNDEKKYQALLAQVRAEYEAIQDIVAGNGDESEVGPVSEGDSIAQIIPGASCNSGGAHLHFIVSRNGSTQNPFSYLKPIESDNNSGSGSDCSQGSCDPFNPSGSWNWPIEPKIQFNQGYGATWAVRNTWVGRIYSFHNGIDISGPSLTVKAVQSGTLYRGSYGGSCRLRYVRVHHTDGLDTFYLHINYTL